MIQFQWLRRFIRRHTAPISHDAAGLWKHRLSVAYMLFAWNAFGFVMYNMFTGKHNWAAYYGLPQDDAPPAQQWTKTLGIKEAKVIRVSGFHVDKYQVKNTFDDDTNQVLSSQLVKEDSS